MFFPRPFIYDWFIYCMWNNSLRNDRNLGPPTNSRTQTCLPRQDLHRCMGTILSRCRSCSQRWLAFVLSERFFHSILFCCRRKCPHIMKCRRCLYRSLPARCVMSFIIYRYCLQTLGVGLLVVTIWLELYTSHSSSCHHSPPLSSLAPVKSRMETFWYWLTQVHLENGR